jgi:hypothetical protein
MFNKKKIAAGAAAVAVMASMFTITASAAESGNMAAKPAITTVSGVKILPPISKAKLAKYSGTYKLNYIANSNFSWDADVPEDSWTVAEREAEGLNDREFSGDLNLDFTSDKSFSLKADYFNDGLQFSINGKLAYTVFDGESGGKAYQGVKVIQNDEPVYFRFQDNAVLVSIGDKEFGFMK